MTSDIASVGAEVVDEAVAAADGVRKAARWMASAFGGVPSLAILGSVVRSPGKGHFDPPLLATGVGLATCGAVLAVLGFARVLAPVPLEDTDLESLDLRRIPGQPYRHYADLVRDMDDVRAATLQEEHREARTAAEARRAEAEMQAAQSAEDKSEKSTAAAAATAAAVAAASAHATWEAQLVRRDAIRTKAYRLKAADEVGRHYRQALLAAVVAAALIAAGVVLLGLAPQMPAGGG